MKYFTNFPKIQYQFSDRILPMTNIFIRPDPEVFFTPEPYGEFTTFIEDGWSPDDTAREIYGDDDYFWFVLLQNNILDFYKEWPTSYDYWLSELSKIYNGQTFYTRYLLDVKVGDIIAKRINITEDSDENSVDFDKNNSGVVVSVDPFFRSFDVSPINGNIAEGDEFLILREDYPSFERVQNLNNGEIYHYLQRKEKKLESVAQFYTRNEQGKRVPISPYSDLSGSDLASTTIPDMLMYPELSLTRYITRTDGNMYYESFSTVKQKEWLFKKNIKTIPIADLTVLDNAYAELFLNEGVDG